MKFTINNLSVKHPTITVEAKSAKEALKKAKEIAGIVIDSPKKDKKVSKKK